MAGEKGSSWEMFEKKARDNELLPSRVSSRHPISPTTGRLCREDMAIYGELPVSDSLTLVVCQHCSRVVKSEAVAKHKACYHTELSQSSLHFPSAPPPSHLHPHSVAHASNAQTTNSSSREFSRRHNVDEDDGTTGFIASALPTIATSSAMPSSSGRDVISDHAVGKQHKEYNPDKHCGVWVESERRHCTHSFLNCKLHNMNERKLVKGRSASFEDLAEEHKQQRKSKKLEKLWADAGLQDMGKSRHSVAGRGSPSSPVCNSSPVNEMAAVAAPVRENAVNDKNRRRNSTTSPYLPRKQSPLLEKVEPPEKEDPLLHYPKPLATSPLTCFWRKSPAGRILIDRRSDSLRSKLARALGMEDKLPVVNPPSNFNMEALMESHRNRKRKYFRHRDQMPSLQAAAPSSEENEEECPVLRPYKLPVPPSLTPATPIPSTPTQPPITPSQPLATPTAQPQAPPHLPHSQTSSHHQEQNVRSEHFFPSSHPLPPPPPAPVIYPSDSSQVSVFDYRATSHVLPAARNTPHSVATVALPSVNLPSSAVTVRPSDFINAAPTHVPSVVHSMVSSTASVPSVPLQQMARHHESSPTSTGLAVGALNTTQLQSGQLGMPNNRPHGDAVMGRVSFTPGETDLERNGLAIGGKRKKGTTRSNSSHTKKQRMDHQYPQHFQHQPAVVEEEVDAGGLQPSVSTNQERDRSNYINVAGQTLSIARQPLSVAGQPLSVAGQPLSVAGQPLSVAGQPLSVAGQPLSVAGQPLSVAGQPLSVAGQPLSVAGQHLQVARQSLSVAGQPHLTSRSAVANSIQSLRQVSALSSPRASLQTSMGNNLGATRTEDFGSRGPSGPLRIENPGLRGPTGPLRMDDSGPRGPSIPFQADNSPSRLPGGLLRTDNSGTRGHSGPVRTDNSGPRGPSGPIRTDNSGPRGSSGPIRTDNSGPRGSSGPIRTDNSGPRGSSGPMRIDNSGPRGPSGPLAYYDSGAHLPSETTHPQRPTVLSTQRGVAAPISRSPADPLRNRLGVASQATTSPQATVAASVPVATPLSLLASSGHATSRSDVRRAPEFGYIRVKMEPVGDDEEEGRGTPPRPTSASTNSTRSLPNGLVSSSPHVPPSQTTPTSSVGSGSLRGVASSDGGSAVLFQSPPSFNSLHSASGQTLLLNPSLAQHQVGNFLGLSQLYSNQQRILAAAAAAQSSGPSVQQQIANLRQLEMYKLMIQQQQQQQQQQQARLLQPSVMAASKAQPTLPSAGGGGVVNYQAGNSTGTPAANIPNFQLPVANRLPTSIAF